MHYNKIDLSKKSYADLKNILIDTWDGYGLTIYYTNDEAEDTLKQFKDCDYTTISGSRVTRRNGELFATLEERKKTLNTVSFLKY